MVSLHIIIFDMPLLLSIDVLAIKGQFGARAKNKKELIVIVCFYIFLGLHLQTTQIDPSEYPKITLFSLTIWFTSNLADVVHQTTDIGYGQF